MSTIVTDARPNPEPPRGGDIVRIPFHGDEILAVEVDGRPHIVLKPAIEALGLDYWAQVRKLNARSWATTASKPVVAADGKRREMVICDVRTFLMLLATVDEKRVAADVAPKLVTYQAEVADAIESYWTRGAALNPRVVAPVDPIALLRGMLDQLAVVQQAGHLALTAATEAGQDARLANARLDAIEGQHDWLSALAFAKLNGLSTETAALARLGKLAATMARADGIEPRKVQHMHYGAVNALPVHIWQRAAATLGGGV